MNKSHSNLENTIIFEEQDWRL